YMTSGSLFRQANTGWTGPLDSCAPDRLSSNCTNSNVFRLATRRSFDGSIKVSLALRNNSDIHDSGCNATDTCWHGVHVWLRYQSQFDLYYVSINRADNTAVIKRKVPCGSDNQGTYFVLSQGSVSSSVSHVWTPGVWQHYSITIQTNADGSVTIKAYD